MVRGLVSDLTFLYTMFAAASLSGGLTRLGFRPLVTTRDGAENILKVTQHTVLPVFLHWCISFHFYACAFTMRINATIKH